MSTGAKLVIARDDGEALAPLLETLLRYVATEALALASGRRYAEQPPIEALAAETLTRQGMALAERLLAATEPVRRGRR